MFIILYFPIFVQAMLRFWQLPKFFIPGLTAEDLTLLLSGGCGDIPFEKLCSIITFVNSIGCSQKRLEQFKRWFWKIVKDMTQTERQQLLYFATGKLRLDLFMFHVAINC